MVASNSATGRSDVDSNNLQLQFQRGQLEARQAGIEKQIELIEGKKRRLVVRSPIAGRVVTWNVDQLLRHRPVKVGEMLLGVVDPRDDWELEIHMPGTRMGHLNTALAGLEADERLEVSYILATDPSQRLAGSVGRADVSNNNELHEEEGNGAKLRVRINKRDVADPRPGATVIADVHCGWRPIGYVWFHEAFEWVQKTWFYYL
jgi:hypothetical protein